MAGLERSQDVVYAPFVEWKRRPFAGKWVNVSASGERIFRRPTELRASAPVIRFFGGSTMWGTGVVDSETIPAIYSGATQGAVSTTTATRRSTAGRTSNAWSISSPRGSARTSQSSTRASTTRSRSAEPVWSSTATASRSPCDASSRGPTHWDSSSTARPSQLLRKVVGAGHTELRCDSHPARARRVAETVLNIWNVARTLVNANCGRIVVVLQPVAYVGRPSIDYLELADTRVFEEHGKELRAVYRCGRRQRGSRRTARGSTT